MNSSIDAQAHPFSKSTFLWSALAVFVVYAGLTFAFAPFVADDAYIVGRYAANFAEGHGLVYNRGEYISALTSPLHALLEGVFAKFGLDPVST